MPREWFHISTIVVGGKEKMFALAGRDNSPDKNGNNSGYFNTVEEWVEESSSWKAADNLLVKRSSVGAVLATRHLVCLAGFPVSCLCGTSK